MLVHQPTEFSHQDIPADALEDAPPPQPKQPDEGAEVGRVHVLHVRDRHLQQAPVNERDPDSSPPFSKQVGRGA